MKQKVFGSKRKVHSIIVPDSVSGDEFWIDVTITDECVVITISDRKRLSLASKRQLVCMMLSHNEFALMSDALADIAK